MLYRGHVALCAMLLAGVASSVQADDYSDVVDALDPIHWWQFNEPLSSPTANDSVASLNGTWHNGPNHYTPGLGGTDSHAAKFWDKDGPTWAVIPHSQSLLLEEGSISFYFIDTGKVHNSSILSKDSEYFDNGGHLDIHTTTGPNNNHGGLEVRLQSDTGSHVVSTDDIFLNTQYHVVFTFGDGGMKLYINGSLVDQNGYTGGMLGNLEPLVLGASTAWSGNQTHTPLKWHWSGILDELLIFDYALDGEQVTSLYRQVPTLHTPEPASAALLGVGAAMVLSRRRRR